MTVSPDDVVGAGRTFATDNDPLACATAKRNAGAMFPHCANERRFAPDVAAMLPKVQLTVDDAIPPDFDQMHAIVNVWLKDGQQLSKRVDKLSGWIGLPLTREQRLKKFFGCGVVRSNHGDRMAYRVRGLDHLNERIVPFFEKHPLKSKKRVDFARFRKILHLINQGKHLNIDGIEEIRAIASVMNTGSER